MSWISWIFGWHARANIRKEFHAIAEVLFVHLQRLYSGEWAENGAMEVATAVTTALLGPPPGDEAALRSVSVDPQVVEANLERIGADSEICWMVSLFRLRRNRVAGEVTSATVAADERLRKLGILLPADAVQLPSSHRALMREVKKFELMAKRV